MVDPPDPEHKRPQLLKRQYRKLMRDGASLNEDDDEDCRKLTRLQEKAFALKKEMEEIQGSWDRAARHPVTRRTMEWSGALLGEPMENFPRALRRMLVGLGINSSWADHLIDAGTVIQKGEF